MQVLESLVPRSLRLSLRRLILIARALGTLVAVDFRLRKSGFAGLHQTLAKSRTSIVLEREPESVTTLCAAVENAAFWYFRQVRCLEKSATLALILRKFGVHAVVVIGCRKLPFASHAWVEVEGQVVNDDQSVRQTYLQIDRI